jgi:hypothetical protein
MAGLCLAMIAALWLEHFLLLGPAFHPGAADWGIGIWEVVMGFGFAGLMAFCVSGCLNRFPVLLTAQQDHDNNVAAETRISSAITG